MDCYLPARETNKGSNGSYNKNNVKVKLNVNVKNNGPAVPPPPPAVAVSPKSCGLNLNTIYLAAVQCVQGDLKDVDPNAATERSPRGTTRTHTSTTTNTAIAKSPDSASQAIRRRQQQQQQQPDANGNANQNKIANELLLHNSKTTRSPTNMLEYESTYHRQYSNGIANSNSNNNHTPKSLGQTGSAKHNVYFYKPKTATTTATATATPTESNSNNPVGKEKHSSSKKAQQQQQPRQHSSVSSPQNHNTKANQAKKQSTKKYMQKIKKSFNVLYSRERSNSRTSSDREDKDKRVRQTTSTQPDTPQSQLGEALDAIDGDHRHRRGRGRSKGSDSGSDRSGNHTGDENETLHDASCTLSAASSHPPSKPYDCFIHTSTGTTVAKNFSPQQQEFADHCEFPESTDDTQRVGVDLDLHGNGASDPPFPHPHRFPTWSAVSGSQFRVRTGPDYARNKRKAPSGESLYETIAVRGYLSEARSRHPCSFLPLPLIKDLSVVHTRQDFAPGKIYLEDVRIPHVFVVHVELPMEAPSLFQTEDDGRGPEILFYLKPSAKFLEEVNHPDPAQALSPASRLLIQWCRECTTSVATRSRFKCIATVRNLADHGIAWAKSYNGKPVLITKSGSVHRGEHFGVRYLEMTANVHAWPYMAKKGFVSLLPKFKDMLVDVGFTVEARTDDELPECILGAACVNYADIDKLIPMDPILMKD